MTTQADHPDPGSRDARLRAASIADQWTRRAILDMVRGSGGEITDRPIFQGAATTVPDAEPMAALQVIRYVESATANARHRYIRAAREAGSTWHDIGAVLDLGPVAAWREIPLAEVAYQYAAGEPESAWSNTSFPWTCNACAGLIIDRGPACGGGPEDDEPGHAQGCTRLAAAVAAFDAQWGTEA